MASNPPLAPRGDAPIETLFTLRDVARRLGRSVKYVQSTLETEGIEPTRVGVAFALTSREVEQVQSVSERQGRNRRRVRDSEGRLVPA